MAPFDSSNAAGYGQKGGNNRWRSKEPASSRTKYLALRVSPNELAMINGKAASAGISRTELVVRAVRELAKKQKEC